MQKFNFTHMTAIYDGGKYTLTADKGYTLRHRTSGTTAPEAVTRDYTKYEVVPTEGVQALSEKSASTIQKSASTPRKSAKANKKSAKAK